jgi:hypothetical protein
MKWTKEKAYAFNKLLELFDEVLDRHVPDKQDYERYDKRQRKILDQMFPERVEERNLFKQ